MRRRPNESDRLLLAITRCPDLDAARRVPGHACTEIVRVQDTSDFKVPEPWSGHIETAPILFIGANPSVGGGDGDPTPSWTDADTVSYFQRRFDQPGGWIGQADFNKVAYWRSVRARARELLDREPVPGEDFAMTEIVHCKSKKEGGVDSALRACATRWLSRVVAQSPARVVVVLGRHSGKCCADVWQLEVSSRVHFDIPVGGRSRAVALLPHPNARTMRSFATCVAGKDLDRLQAVLRA